MSARAQGQLLLSLPWSASSRAVQGEAADWEGGGGALEGVNGVTGDGDGGSAEKSISEGGG